MKHERYFIQPQKIEMTPRERRMFLADVLEREARTDQVKRFNMSKWVVETPCGTVVCACGRAAELPEFQAQGFSFAAVPLTNQPHYKGRYGYAAAADLLGLTLYQGQFIFSPDHYSAIEGADAMLEVARRLRGIA